jgi:hypothetical protein
MAPVAHAIKSRGGLITASLFTLWPDAQGEPMISAHLKERRPFLRKGDFAPGSRGQANVDVLAPLVDVSVFKVAYSAFFNTQLDWVLKKSGIDTLVVCGIVTNGGVASTVRDARARLPRRCVVGRLRRFQRSRAPGGAGRHGFGGRGDGQRHFFEALRLKP